MDRRRRSGWIQSQHSDADVRNFGDRGPVVGGGCIGRTWTQRPARVKEDGVAGSGYIKVVVKVKVVGMGRVLDSPRVSDTPVPDRGMNDTYLEVGDVRGPRSTHPRGLTGSLSRTYNLYVFVCHRRRRYLGRDPSFPCGVLP